MKRMHNLAKTSTRIGICIALLWQFGCTTIGPKRVIQDRFDYNGAVAESRQTQTLLNIVRLRYSEWPVFLDVEQIVSQYTWEQFVSVKPIIRTPFKGDNDQLEGLYSGKYSERPVVLYKPVKGTKFVKSMLTPVPPGSLLGLVYTGWPADRLLSTMAHSVNGHRNVQLQGGRMLRPHPIFADFLETLRAFQVNDALVIEVERQPLGESNGATVATRITFRTELADEPARRQLTETKKLLGLDQGMNTYQIVWGSVAPDANTIALETRSLLQLMEVLSANVEVPQTDRDEGRVALMEPWPEVDRSGLAPLMKIRQGEEAPTDAHITCVYRDRFFWIDDTDLDSKMTFAYLSMLLTLVEADHNAGTPLVITTN
ncbi:MAG: hypothetical protein QNK37_03125 [Acidobacteriota bacterium]|nr:hypothetical protein [Acidobacteriota bacterium]